MFSNILVAYDGSAHAKVALREAADIATTQLAALEVVTVFSTQPDWAGAMYPGMSQDVVDSLVAAARGGAQASLDEALAAVPEGVRVSGVTVEGHAADAILAEAQRCGADLVVVGSRGRGTAKSLLLGSVSNRLVHDSPVAVLVVHQTSG